VSERVNIRELREWATDAWPAALTAELLALLDVADAARVIRDEFKEHFSEWLGDPDWPEITRFVAMVDRLDFGDDEPLPPPDKRPVP